MINALGELSGSIAGIVAAVAPVLCAIRSAPNRHVTGLLLEGGVIVTVDQALPAAEGYTVVLSGRSLVSVRPGPRDPDANLAVLRLDTPVACSPPAWCVAVPGNVVLVLGADADGSPTVRLTVVHRLVRGSAGLSPILDLPGSAIGQGDLVLDSNGCLVGLAAVGPNNEAVTIPSAAVARLAGASPDHRPVSPVAGRRGWLGVSLQPISIPDELIARAGQASGRMVVSITPGGPADKAGLRVNDVLLALNDSSTSGPNALRAFLGGDRIGSNVEVRLMREGIVLAAHLIVGAQPG